MCYRTNQTSRSIPHEFPKTFGAVPDIQSRLFGFFCLQKTKLYFLKMMEREGCSHVVFSCCPCRCRAQRQRTNKQVEMFHGGWAESRHPSGSVLTQFNHRQNKCAERGLGAGMGAGLRGQPAPSRECKPSLRHAFSRTQVHLIEKDSTWLPRGQVPSAQV